jgi:hypothetical protein
MTASNVQNIEDSAPCPVHTKRNFVLWQGRKAFSAGSILFWYSTGRKRFSDAARGQKNLCVDRT